MTNETKAQKLIGVKDLLRNSWNIYKKDFKKFLVIAVIFFGITSLMMTFISPEIPKIPEAEVQPTPTAFMPSQVTPVLTLPWDLFSLIILATSLISILGTASLVFAVKETPQEWKIRDVLKKAWSKYLSFLWVAVLVGLAVLLGSLLFIIPGIIFVIWFNFSYYCLICEEKRGTKALSRSRQLVKGHWWPVAKRVFALIIIAIPLSMSSAFIPYLGQLAFTVLFAPFSIIYNYLIYQNLREIKG